jgi:hypothetical protein
MSDIQRWTDTAAMYVDEAGPWVQHADHVEALREAVESLAAMYRARLSAYDEGQRDALATAVNSDAVQGAIKLAVRDALAWAESLTSEVQRAIDYLTFMGSPIPEGSARWETRATAVLVCALRDFAAIKGDSDGVG